VPRRPRLNDLRLNPAIDVAPLARRFREDRRVRVFDLLEAESASRLHAYLDAQDGWWHLINSPDGVLEFDRAARARIGARRRAALDETVFAAARTGFQYRYEGLRVPDDPGQLASDNDPLTAFARLMSSVAMLDMLRHITGEPDISFSDGHATAYGPGDFLTGHDDNVPGKNRIAAYVFGLTPMWRPEWGGILMFHEPGEAKVTGHVPSFNTLDLFAVPQRHSVSIVTPAAPIRRFAVTGWLRHHGALSQPIAET
jgi:Rps23 Pro-64 3,4-dihydroxylase Tpa1-like proline 4-hydroxylase